MKIKTITYAWKWDNNLTISMRATDESHPKKGDMIRLIEVMIQPQVKNPDEWVLLECDE